MSKAKKPSRQARDGKKQGQSFCDPNLRSVNPNKEQFAPTTASPIPQHKKMAGVS